MVRGLLPFLLLVRYASMKSHASGGAPRGECYTCFLFKITQNTTIISEHEIVVDSCVLTYCMHVEYRNEKDPARALRYFCVDFWRVRGCFLLYLSGRK